MRISLHPYFLVKTGRAKKTQCCTGGQTYPHSTAPQPIFFFLTVRHIFSPQLTLAITIATVLLTAPSPHTRLFPSLCPILPSLTHFFNPRIPLPYLYHTCYPIHNSTTMTVSKSSDRRCLPPPALTISMLFTLTLLPVLHLSRKHSPFSRFPLFGLRLFPWKGSNDSPLPPLKIVTLSFNLTEERFMIDHNCALLSRTRHIYEIHTDNLTHPFCQICSCRRFIPTNCPCPSPTTPGCPLCEKLAFLARLMRTSGEIVFLDSDLVILRPDFPDALQTRAQHFDFLASYGFGNTCSWKHTSPFNSGLMFIRRLSSVNYAHMLTLMRRMGGNNDQNVISPFVRDRYLRWDTLSLRWHCRYLHKAQNDIPVDQCFTFHGRGRAVASVMSKLNRTLLRTADLAHS